MSAHLKSLVGQTVFSMKITPMVHFDPIHSEAEQDYWRHGGCNSTLRSTLLDFPTAKSFKKVLKLPREEFDSYELFH